MGKDEDDGKAKKEESDDEDDKPLSAKKDTSAKKEDEEEDDDSDDEGTKKGGGRRDRRSRERRRRDRDRKRREEKKNTDSGKSKAGVIDDSILEKSEDPHEIMEVYQWPMPLPEDAGRIRAAYAPAGQTHEFWETYEEFFKPVSEEAVKAVLADGPEEDLDDAFKMPRLGQHWSEGKSIREEPSPDMNDDDLPLKGARVGGKRKIEPVLDDTAPQTPEERLRSQKMTMRMLACFIQQDGVSSAPESSGSSDQAQVMKAVADAAVQHRNPGAEMLNMKIERRIRVELTNLGLMERADIEYDAEHLREDDVICAQLRLNQEALRKHTKERDLAQSGSRKRLRACVETHFQKEKLLTDVLNAAKAVTDSILPKFKYAKGIKPQDMKKNVETWDRAYAKYKAYLANPTKRKPILPTAACGKKVLGDKCKSGNGGARPPASGGGGGGMWGGGASSSNAKAMAAFHQSLQRKT